MTHRPFYFIFILLFCFYGSLVKDTVAYPCCRELFAKFLCTVYTKHGKLCFSLLKLKYITFERHKQSYKH